MNETEKPVSIFVTPDIFLVGQRTFARVVEERPQEPYVDSGKQVGEDTAAQDKETIPGVERLPLIEEQQQVAAVQSQSLLSVKW